MNDEQKSGESCVIILQGDYHTLHPVTKAGDWLLTYFFLGLQIN